MQKNRINIQNKHIRECNWNNKNIFLQRYFHEESNDWIKNMCHRARFLCFGDFSEKSWKNKDYKKCCLPFQPFLFVYALCISLGGDIAIID